MSERPSSLTSENNGSINGSNYESLLIAEEDNNPRAESDAEARKRAHITGPLEDDCEEDYYEDIKNAYIDLKKKQNLNVDEFFRQIVSVIDEFSNEELNQCVSWRGERTAKYFKSFFSGNIKRNTNKTNCRGGKLELYNELKHILVWTNNRLFKGRLSLSVTGAANKNYLLNENLSSKNGFIYLLLYCFTGEDIKKNDKYFNEYQYVSHNSNSKHESRHYIKDKIFKNEYPNIYRIFSFINNLRNKIIKKIRNYQDYKDLFVERELKDLSLQQYKSGSFKYQIIGPLTKFLGNINCYAQLKNGGPSLTPDAEEFANSMNIVCENLFGFEYKASALSLTPSKEMYTKSCVKLLENIKMFERISPFIKEAESELRDSEEKKNALIRDLETRRQAFAQGRGRERQRVRQEQREPSSTRVQSRNGNERRRSENQKAKRLPTEIVTRSGKPLVSSGPERGNPISPLILEPSETTDQGVTLTNIQEQLTRIEQKIETNHITVQGQLTDINTKLVWVQPSAIGANFGGPTSGGPTSGGLTSGGYKNSRKHKRVSKLTPRRR